MASFTTKFDLGDSVYRVHYDTTEIRLPCRYCHGTGQVTATLADDSTEQIRCPRHTSGNGMATVQLGSWPEWRADPTPLVIGQIQLRVTDRSASASRPERMSIGENMDPRSRMIANTEDEEGYMAWATGVGSGSVYKAADLFADLDEAEEEAERRTELSRAGEPVPGSNYGTWKPTIEQVRIAGGFLDHRNLYEHDAGHVLLAEAIVAVAAKQERR